MKEFDKVQLRMLFDWSDQSPDMIVEEELARIELLVNKVLDAHYEDDTTLDLTIITHEGKLPVGQELKGWTVDEESIWDRIPGDTRDEKRAWLEERHPWLNEG